MNKYILNKNIALERHTLMRRKLSAWNNSNAATIIQLLLAAFCPALQAARKGITTINTLYIQIYLTKRFSFIASLSLLANCHNKIKPQFTEQLKPLKITWGSGGGVWGSGGGVWAPAVWLWIFCRQLSRLCGRASHREFNQFACCQNACVVHVVFIITINLLMQLNRSGQDIAWNMQY